jgi:crotonobetaine/carnitine-CoA ligase
MSDRTWIDDGDERTIVDLLRVRLDRDPDGEYLDVVGTKLSAADVADIGGRIASVLAELGVRPGGRVATLVENSPEAVLAWWGIIIAGGIAVPINTAYKGEYLRHQLADSGSTVLLVEPDLAERAARVEQDVPGLDHTIVLGDGSWRDRLASATPATPVQVNPADLGTFIYTGGTTGPSKGCMLSHRYHEVLSRQIGAGTGTRMMSPGRRCRCFTSTPSLRLCSDHSYMADAVRSSIASRCRGSGRR